MPTPLIEDELLTEMIDTLERVDCQFDFCDGPTLEPVDMVTCFRCATLAKARAAAGLPPRLVHELTAEQSIRWRDEVYAARACGRRVPTFEEFMGLQPA